MTYLTNQPRSMLLAALAILILIAGCQASAETIDGFVISATSKKQLTVGTLQVSINDETVCRSELTRANIRLRSKTYDGLLAHTFVDFQHEPIASSVSNEACDSLPLHAGAFVRIICVSKCTATTAVAQLLTMFVADDKTTLSGGALLEEPARFSKTIPPLVGTIWLDGYPFSITKDTDVMTAPVGTELQFRAGRFEGPRMRATSPKGPVPALSANLIGPNTWATYEGIGDQNVQLDRVRIWPNQITDKERRIRAALTPEIHAPDYSNHTAGSIVFPQLRVKGAVNILPYQRTQEFVSAIGNSIIPPYQVLLPESDPTKIQFRFYVVQSVGPMLEQEAKKLDGVGSLVQPTSYDAVVALPNGFIFVPDRMLARMTDSAQLAFLLSYAVTTVLQKQVYLTKTAKPVATFDEFTPAFLPFDMSVPMSEQALRVGTRQLYLAGYDITEAPLAWASALGSQITNPMVDRTTQEVGFSWHAAVYTSSYISKYFVADDFSGFKQGKDEYAMFLKELRTVDPDCFRQ